MESNWRYNVWDVGMIYSGYELYARLVPPFPPGWAIVKTGVGPNGGLIVTTAPGQLPEVITDFTVGPASRFPYGFPVEPD